MLGCHIYQVPFDGECYGEPELPGIDSLEECCRNNGSTFLGDDGICVSCESKFCNQALCTVSRTVVYIRCMSLWLALYKSITVHNSCLRG